MWAPQYGTPQTYYQYGGRVKRAVDPATEEELKQFAGKIPFLYKVGFQRNNSSGTANLTLLL